MPSVPLGGERVFLNLEVHFGIVSIGSKEQNKLSTD